eukprot:CFRG4447T1
MAKAPRKQDDGPCFRTLAKDVQNEGKKSVYLDRIRRKVDVEQELKTLEMEVLEEIAVSLGRTGDKTNWSFYKLEEAERSLDVFMEREGEGDAKERISKIREFNRLREIAYEERRKLLIHRQACGFKSGNWQTIDKSYPLPARRKEC